MVEPGSDALSPPAFLTLAGDPVRWRLLRALGGSDLRVGELCEGLGLAQNLVSYHLAQLRSAGLIRRRRSDADGRDSYYAIDLARCAALLAEVAALHPALQAAPRSATAPPFQAAPATAVESTPKRRVLFVCTGNSARSRIAEALLAELSGGSVEATSAGSHPKPLHPNAARVLRERGIPPVNRGPTELSEVQAQRFDYVITLCDRVRELCPEFPHHPRVLHWSVADPARAGTGDEDTYLAFAALGDELEQRIGFLLARIDADRDAA